jgi:hypothetical protein
MQTKRVRSTSGPMSQDSRDLVAEKFNSFTTSQRICDCAKSQFTRFQNASTYFARALR